MNTPKITIPALLEIRTEDGGTVYASFDRLLQRPNYRRLLPNDRARFDIARARLCGEFYTAEDVVLTLDQ